MSILQKPLVLESDSLGQPTLQRLQIGKELDIPLNCRVETLENQIALLVDYLIMQGIELPDELTDLT